MSKLLKKFYGKVEKGRLKHNDPATLAVYLRHFEGKEVETTIQEKKYIRSLNQNSYYWGVVIPIIGDELGYFGDEMHGVLGQKFLKYVDDKGNERIKSTAKMKTNEFNDYLERVKIWASAEFNIYVPDPNMDIEWGAEEEI